MKTIRILNGRILRLFCISKKIKQQKGKNNVFLVRVATGIAEFIAEDVRYRYISLKKISYFCRKSIYYSQKLQIQKISNYKAFRKIAILRKLLKNTFYHITKNQ